MEFSHSDPLIRRRGERTMGPYTLETLRLIEEYGSEEEVEPVDLEDGTAGAGDIGQSALQAETEASYRFNGGISSTYGHSQLKTGHPVRSAIHKQLNGRLVLRWVTTWESLLLYVLIFLLLPARDLMFGISG
ncbi:hypothetical protein KCU65_g7113, partial [Aureobasidium melanogenum]